jgi:Protein of unknown function (DUF1631)
VGILSLRNWACEPNYVGLTQNRPSVVVPPCRTKVLSSSARLAGTILRKPIKESISDRTRDKTAAISGNLNKLLTVPRVEHAMATQTPHQRPSATQSNSATSSSTVTPSSSTEAVLRSLVPVATQQASGQIDAFSARLAGAMLNASESITDAREASLTYHSAQLLKNNAYAFFYVASSEIEIALRKEVQALKAGDKHTRVDPLLQDVALSLISYEEMDTKLVFSRLSRTLELAHAEELAALNMRISFALECDTISVAQNPFRPELFLKAIHAAWRQFNPETASHNLILPMLRGEIMFDLNTIYVALNKALIQHGVLPELQDSYRVKKTNASAGRATVPTQEVVSQKLKDIFSGQSNLPQNNGNRDDNNYTEGVARFAPAPHNVNGLPQLNDEFAVGNFMPAQGGQGSHGYIQASNPVDSQLFHHLADLQKNMALSQFVAGAQGVMRLSQMSQAMSGMAGSGVEQNTLQLMSKIFDTVFNNQSIPAPIKDLIGILQVPVLKAALVDKQFFFEEAHPARRMVDLMTQYSLAWDESKGTSDPLYQTLQRNVQRVQNEFDEKLTVFEEVVSDIEKFVTEEDEKTKEALEAPIKRALKKEKIKLASIAANNEVSLRVGTGEVVAFVETFLEHKWVKVLTLAYSVKDEKPNAVTDALKTMDDLLWSVKPKITLDQRQELLNRLPAILTRLNKWLAVITWNDDERAQFFADLAECHASIVRAPLDLSPERQVEIAVEAAQKAAERRQEKKAQAEAQQAQLVPQPHADEYADTVANLERGIWLDMTWKTGSTSRVRLAWISPMRNLFIFTTSKKEQSFSLSVEEVEEAFSEKRAQILMVDKVVDRALIDALEEKSEAEQQESVSA